MKTLFFDFKLSFGSESITQLLKNYNWLNLTARSIKIGDYAKVIERLSKVRNKTNILYTIDKNPELKIVNFQIDLVLAHCFLQLNDLQASTNILENIDKVKLSNIAKNIENFSFFRAPRMVGMGT